MAVRFFLLAVVVATVACNDYPPGMVIEGHEVVYQSDTHSGFGPQSVTHGPRCGYFPPPADSLAAANEINVTAARLFEENPKTINIIFHVVHSSTSGKISQQMIDSQIKVLNVDFESAGFQFVVSKVLYHENDAYYTGCAGQKSTRMFNEYAETPDTHMNIYTCAPSGGILGYAYFPEENRRQTNVDGVVLLHSSLPGGSAAPYNHGATGTHEVGHYLGLYHTFHGGCNGGDMVSDTPRAANPNFGCPSQNPPYTCDTYDDYTNFMDYVDDNCMNHFSPGQIQRMQSLSMTLRPGLF